MNLEGLTSNFALLGFACGAVFYLLSFQKNQAQIFVARLAFALLVVATGAGSLASIMLLSRASFAEVAGLLLASLVGWLAIIGHLKFNMRLIGALVAPLCTLILLVQFFVAPTGFATTEGAPSISLIGLHVLMAVLGEAFAIIACGVSVLYLWQQNLLKKKLLTQLTTNVPAIDKLDRLLTLSLLTGFIFITLSLLSGAIYTQVFVPRSELHLEFKVIWAVIVWLWYLATLLSKNIFNRPGKRIAQMSLAGFVLLAVTYFGMGFFRPFGG